MGLFDAFREATAVSFTPQSAVMTIVVGAIKSDGVIEDEEIRRLRSMCARSPIFAANTSDQDDRIIDFADKLTDREGKDAAAKAAKALTPALRETAFAFACDMVLADGHAAASEQRFLESLSASLQLSDRVAQLLVESAVIRNRSIER